MTAVTSDPGVTGVPAIDLTVPAATAGPPAPSDAVGRADGVREAVASQLHELLDDGTVVRDVFVGWVAALDAAGCPVRYRASGADGWGFPGWSPALAGASVGRAALVRHLDRTSSPIAGPTLPEPLEAVRDWLREAGRAPASSVAEWIAELVQDGDKASVAATAANATRWMAGFVRTVGWPLPERLAVVVDNPEGSYGRAWPKRWRLKGTPVSVGSSPDAVVGKVAPSGQFDLLVHRPSAPLDGALCDRAAFEAAAGALSNRIVPANVKVTTADTGDCARFPVTAELLDRGVELIVGVVRQRLIAADAAEPDDAAPSPTCHWCPELDTCGSGQAWVAGPGRWRGGLPTLG
jgi:hypothetical protein